MLLSGHQPNYLPYPGLIGKIIHSDKFIYVSKVQLEKKSWQNRNRIKGANGEILLTVPVLTKGKFEQTIAETKINNSTDWRQKHYTAIDLSYRKAPYYHAYIDFFRDLYHREWEDLNTLDIYITNWILDELKVKTPVFYDTDFSFDGVNNQLLTTMTKELSCDTYLSNKGSQNYVSIDWFMEQGLNHQYLDYVGKEYRQCFKGFIPYLSIIDMLFNLGANETYDLLADKENYIFSQINKTIEESM